ncbi:MAG TPA: cysteine hydrolase [Terriglobia bacterium]|nr:cysteine hydrolase [Terriglobia bacterium]
MSVGLHAQIDGHALHVVIDMQVLFDSHPDWGVADLRRILPQVLRLAQARPQQTVCTRFVPPSRPEDAAASWQRYYHYWRNATLDRAGAGAIELVDELAALPIAGLIDKSGYSAHSSPDFAPLLQQRGVRTLILSGVETDVCVWATALTAIDHGLRVIIARDAVTSGDLNAHEAILRLAAERFAQQIELASVDEILAGWVA